MKQLLNKLSLSLVLLASFSLVALPLPAHAALFDGSTEQACEGLTVAGGVMPACDDTSSKDVTNVIRTIIQVISLAVGIVAVIMIIVAGLKYITSQGDSNSINSAKNTLLYAVIGLMVAALAQFIVRFALTRSTSPPACPAGQTRQADGACR